MKVQRWVGVAAVLGVLGAAGPARAAGINLSWDDCGASGKADKFGTSAFSCNSNSSTPDRVSRIIGSYVLADSIPNLVGSDITLELKSSGGTLAPWWDFTNFPVTATPGCRAGQLSCEFRSSALSCADWPGPAAVSGYLAFERGVRGPDRARIRLMCAYTSGEPQHAEAGKEYVSFVLTLQNGKTRGPARCAGCEQAVCMTLTGITISQAPANPTPVQLTVPIRQAQITWHGARAPNLCSAQETGGSSLKQVKGLYRE